VAVSATNLISLARLAERRDYLELATTTFQSSAEVLSRVPGSIPTMAIAVSRYLKVTSSSPAAESSP